MQQEKYSDEDLEFFKNVILEKLSVAKVEFEKLKKALSDPAEVGLGDNMSAYQALEDGSATLEREQISHLASRQKKFIENLENALIRISQKTYGVCRVTGKLIPKERLIAVPHATLSVEAKNNQ